MIKITLPDGSVKEYQSGVTPMQVAQSISEGLARNVLSASFNGKIVESVTPLTTDGSLTLYTWDNSEGKKAFWHSSAHILAQALEELYPGIKLTIGPAIEVFTTMLILMENLFLKKIFRLLKLSSWKLHVANTNLKCAL